jgi:hypothetical protein
MLRDGFQENPKEMQIDFFDKSVNNTIKQLNSTGATGN